MKRFALPLIAILTMVSCARQGQKSEQAEEAALNQTEVIENKQEAAPTPASEAEFFAALEKEDGVKSTPSGLHYKVVKEGEGAKPAPTSTVVVDYKGSFTDGTEFDSGNGISFPLNGVIPGFSEGIQLMSPGAEYILYIPYALGYGENGAGGVIPPCATLVFDVKLNEIK